MLKALTSTESLTSLKQLDLSDNSELWRRPEAVTDLLDSVLPRQTQLKQLVMEHSYFTSDLTEKILTKLAQTARLR